MSQAIHGGRPAAQSGIGVRPVKTAYQQVADQLRALILAGDLGPGDRLPVESELTEMFGVSRSTIREALRVLSSQSLITTSRGVGGGSVVARPDADDVGEYLETKIGLLTGINHVSVDDLLEARVLLEVPAAGLAAIRRSPEQLELLERDNGRPGRTVHRDSHMRFHLRLAEASGNPLLNMMTAPVFGVLRVRFLRDAAPASFWHEVQGDHEEILDAVRRSDRAAAEQRMAEHLARLRTTYLSIQRAESVEE